MLFYVVEYEFGLDSSNMKEYKKNKPFNGEVYIESSNGDTLSLAENNIRFNYYDTLSFYNGDGHAFSEYQEAGSTLNFTFLMRPLSFQYTNRKKVSFRFLFHAKALMTEKPIIFKSEWYPYKDFL